jgi:hypothetical protein
LRALQAASDLCSGVIFAARAGLPFKPPRHPPPKPSGQFAQFLVCVLIQAMHALNIHPIFCAESQAAQELPV